MPNPRTSSVVRANGRHSRSATTVRTVNRTTVPQSGSRVTRGQARVQMNRDAVNVRAYQLRVLGQAATKGGTLKAAGPPPRAAYNRLVRVNQSAGRGYLTGAATGAVIGAGVGAAFGGANAVPGGLVGFAVGGLAGQIIGRKIGINKVYRPKPSKSSHMKRRNTRTLRDSHGRYAGSAKG